MYTTVLKSFDQYKIDPQQVQSRIGRTLSAVELLLVKHFNYSSYLKSPNPQLKNITSKDPPVLFLNQSTALIVGIKSKNSLHVSESNLPFHIHGVKPQLHYNSPLSKISIGTLPNYIKMTQALVGNEQLIFIHNSRIIYKLLAQNVFIDCKVVKVVDRGLLGENILNLLGNKFGVDIRLPALKRIAIISDKKISGALVVCTSANAKKLKRNCKQYNVNYTDIGSLKTAQFISFFVRNKTKAHLPVSMFKIIALPTASLNPVVNLTPNDSAVKPTKELKNYSNRVLGLWQKINQCKINYFKPKKYTNLSTVILPNTPIAVSTPDNAHLFDKNIKTGSRILIANAARQLICKGYKPFGIVTIYHSGELIMNDDLWTTQEMHSAVTEACQVFKLELMKTLITFNKNSIPRLELCILGAVVKDDQICSTAFNNNNNFITMLGSHRGEMNGSYYQKHFKNQINTNVPTIDQGMESRLQEVVLQGIQTGLIKSAVNVSNGGMSIALMQSLSAAAKDIGARIHLSRKLRQDELLFGETQGLVLVTIDEKDLMEFERICITIGVPSTTIGRVTNDGKFQFNEVVKLDRKRFS